jgi:hypothetical protein
VTLGPLDPGQHWLASGITGLSRQREWDAVVTVNAPGSDGDELGFVVLPDGRLLPDDEKSRRPDLEIFSESLEDALEPPYRALAVRRSELWVVGASSIEVAHLDPDPPGDDLELTFDGTTVALTSDGVPADPSRASALERIASERESGAYSAAAHRLDGDLWEILILAL